MKLFAKENNGKIRVKICGLAKKEDIVACQLLGVDAVGFLIGESKGTYPTDKLTPDEILELRKVVLENMSAVVLIKNDAVDYYEQIIEKVSPNAIQIQSQTIDKMTIKFLAEKYNNVEWIKTIKIQDFDNSNSIMEKINPFIGIVDAILLDSAKGGSGKTHNWNLSKEVASYLKQIRIPVILAGGLNTNNVIEAIEKVQPNMIDLMSGVSLDKGIKNISEIEKLMTIIKKIN